MMKGITLLVKVSRVRDFYFFDRITDRQIVPKQTHLTPSTTVLTSDVCLEKSWGLTMRKNDGSDN